MALWRYKLEHEYRYYSPLLLGIVFENEWVSIKNGLIMIAKEYAWDGCSPVYYFKPLKFWMGTPDGFKGINGHPPSYRASLVHDALCQFRKEIPISKVATVTIFKELLKVGGSPKWMVELYPLAVMLFGPQNWLGYSPVFK